MKTRNEDLIREKFNNQQKQLDEHEKKIEELEKIYTIMAKMDLRITSIENSVSGINSKMEAKDKEKGMKWDKLIDYLFYFILAALLGYVIHQLGIK